jgi:hypothetical protein
MWIGAVREDSDAMRSDARYEALESLLDRTHILLAVSRHAGRVSNPEGQTGSFVERKAEFGIKSFDPQRNRVPEPSVFSNRKMSLKRGD